MNFKLALTAFAVGVLALVGCSAEGSDQGTSTESDLVAPFPTVNVKGAWHAKPGTASSPGFEGIVFNEDGTFFADVNTGIMCITTPCPTSARLEGTYQVIARSLTLTAKDPKDGGYGFYGRYLVTSRDGSLKLDRNGTESAGSELVSDISYCSAASDCAGQNLIHPECVGGWTCSAQSTCAYSCGIGPVTSDVWPADRTQLVAETRGGGFTPPPAPGSTCAVGAAKYTLDLVSRKLDWTVCELTDWNTPMHPVSGSRTIAPFELKKIDLAMRDVSITNEDICGADKPMLNISVTSASKGTVEYTDSFYACMGGERTFVDNIDGVFSAFRDVAGK